MRNTFALLFLEQTKSFYTNTFHSYQQANKMSTIQYYVRRIPTIFPFASSFQRPPDSCQCSPSVKGEFVPVIEKGSLARTASLFSAVRLTFICQIDSCQIRLP